MQSYLHLRCFKAGDKVNCNEQLGSGFEKDDLFYGLYALQADRELELQS